MPGLRLRFGRPMEEALAKLSTSKQGGSVGPSLKHFEVT